MEHHSTYKPGAERQSQHWAQRVTLIRHALHAAIRTKDFGVFKILQANLMLPATDNIATLYDLFATEGDEDSNAIVSSLDELNSALCYVHQDVAKAVYDNIRSSLDNDNQKFQPTEQRLALMRVDISQQAQIADFAVNKIVSSAISLIDGQKTPQIQEIAANVWIAGCCIAADAIQACILALDKFEGALDDFVFLEYTWQSTQTAVAEATSTIKGAMSLMSSQPGLNSRHSSEEEIYRARRHSSVTSGASGHESLAASWVKRLSTVLSGNLSSINTGEQTHTRRFSVDDIRESISMACPVVLPDKNRSSDQFQMNSQSRHDSDMQYMPSHSDIGQPNVASPPKTSRADHRRDGNSPDMPCDRQGRSDSLANRPLSIVQDDKAQNLGGQDFGTLFDIALSPPSGISPLPIV